MDRYDRLEIRAFLGRSARAFLGPGGFSLPAFVSLTCGLVMGIAVLGNLGIASIWPPAVSSDLQPALAGDASFGMEWGSFHLSSVAIQGQGANRLFLLLASVAFMALLIVGANLTILLLRRSAARAREETIRAALGASRRQLILGRLAGAGVFFLTRALVGVVVGLVGKVALALSWPHGLAASPAHFQAGLVVPVLLASLLFILMVSVFPDLPSSSRGGFGRELTGGSRLIGDRYPEGIRAFLPAIQIGLSITLLMGSSFLFHGFLSGERTVNHPGVGAGTVRIPVQRGEPAPGEASVGPLWAGFLSELGEMPGVVDVALFTPGAWIGVGTTDLAWTECGACVIGGMWVPFKGPLVQHHVVSPDSFRAMGVSLSRGREFTDEDGPNAPLVAVVNESYAMEHFDLEGPIGRSLRIGKGPDSWHTVVGVVEDFGVRGIGSAIAPDPVVYLSSLQHPPDRADLFLMMDREGGPPEGIGAVGGSHGFSASEAGALPFHRFLGGPLAPLRWFGMVVLTLGVLTLGIAAFGLFSILEFSVSLRRGEMGVRRALGARPGEVARLVLGRSARIFLLGAFLGLEGSLFLAAWMESVASDAGPFDLRLFLAITGLLALAALVGTLRPARHAMRVPPRVAMGGM